MISRSDRGAVGFTHAPAPTVAHVFAIALGVVLLAPAGCHAPPPPVATVEPGQLAMHRYHAARSGWLEAREAGVLSPEWPDAMATVVRDLEAAGEAPPTPAMFDGALAARLADQGDVAGARARHAAALARCPYWIPSWIGLADLALRARPRDEAEAVRCLREAQAALDVLRVVAVEGARSAESGDLAILIAQLAEDLSWERGLQEPYGAPAISAGSAASVDDTIRRLRARIALREIVIEERLLAVTVRGLEAEALRRVAARVEAEVLPNDPDYGAALLTLAEVWARLDDPARADAILVHFTDPSRSRLARDPGVLLTQVWVLSEWVASIREHHRHEAPDAEDERLLTALIQRMERLFQEHATDSGPAASGVFLRREGVPALWFLHQARAWIVWCELFGATHDQRRKIRHVLELAEEAAAAVPAADVPSGSPTADELERRLAALAG